MPSETVATLTLLLLLLHCCHSSAWALSCGPTTHGATNETSAQTDVFDWGSVSVPSNCGSRILTLNNISFLHPKRSTGPIVTAASNVQGYR